MSKYPALTLIISVDYLLSWITALLFGAGGVFALVFSAIEWYKPTNGALVQLLGPPKGFLIAIALWVVGAILWVYMRASAEIVQVFVDIEGNTRQHPGAPTGHEPGATLQGGR